MMRYNSFTPVPLDSNSDDTDMEDSDSEGEVQHTNGYSLLMQDESNNTNNQSAIVYSSDSEKEEDNYIQEHNKDLDLNDMDVVNAIVEEQLRQLEGVDLNHMGSRLLADAMEKLLTNAKVSSVPKAPSSPTESNEPINTSSLQESDLFATPPVATTTNHNLPELNVDVVEVEGLPENDSGAIKQAMSGFQLPETVHPDWAKSIPESEWMERITSKVVIKSPPSQ